MAYRKEIGRDEQEDAWILRISAKEIRVVRRKKSKQRREIIGGRGKTGCRDREIKLRTGIVTRLLLTTGSFIYKSSLSSAGSISFRFQPNAMLEGSVMPQTRSFNPYTENGGTILAIAGQDFSVIAGDTRQSEGYSIQTRYAPKVFRLCVPDLSLPSLRCRFLTLRVWAGPIAPSWLLTVLLQMGICLLRRSNNV